MYGVYQMRRQNSAPKKRLRVSVFWATRRSNCLLPDRLNSRRKLPGQNGADLAGAGVGAGERGGLGRGVDVAFEK